MMGYCKKILKYGNAGALKFSIIAVLFLLAVTSVLEALGIPLLIPIFETVLGHDPTENQIITKIKEVGSYFGVSIDTNTLVIIVVSTILISILLKYINSILLLAIRRKVTTEFRGQLVESFFWTRWANVLNVKSGELINLIVEKCPLSGDLYFFILQGATSVFYGLLYIGIALYLSIEITVLIIMMFIFLTYLNKILADFARRHSAWNLKYSNLLAANLFDQMRAIKFIFSANLQQRKINEIDSINHNSLGHEFSSRVFLNTSQHFNQFFYVVIILLAIVTSQYLDHSVIELFIILYVIRQFYPQVQLILKAYQVWVVNKPQLEAVIEKIETLRSYHVNDGKIILKEIDDIQFNQVSFRYENSNPLFNRLSFTSKKNKTTAIIGVSGSGKTTIVDLLIGLLNPIEGQILFGAYSLSELNKIELSKKISYVSQDSVLLNGTIKDNIVIRKPDASNKEVAIILEMVVLKDFVNSLPEGLDTEVGENGIKLSGGQKQRIALARALIVSPKLLIMDEATSALDVESEAAIKSAVERIHGSLTIVIIAHRLSTVKSADTIHVIENGQIYESGSYKELMQKKGKLFHFARVA